MKITIRSKIINDRDDGIDDLIGSIDACDGNVFSTCKLLWLFDGSLFCYVSAFAQQECSTCCLCV